MATLVNMIPNTPARFEGELIGSSLGLRRVLNSVQMVARTDSAPRRVNAASTEVTLFAP